MRKLTIAAVALGTLTMTSEASAQCMECSAQLMNATLTANSWQSMNDINNNDIRQRDADKGVYYPANEHMRRDSNVSRRANTPSLGTQTEKAVMSILTPEYRRRAAAQGTASADQWIRSAAGDLGRQVGQLAPEYKRRVNANGQASAESWFVGRARQMANAYVGTRAKPGGAVSGSVPAPTMKRVEDAAYGVLDREIARRKKAYGQADTNVWARTAGATIGAEVGKLKPEYLRRASAGGQADADAWIIARSREIATLYVEKER